MAIDTKNRDTLKGYFKKNAIPTEGNFADLVDAQLNMADDGVFKISGEPLSVVAAQGDQKRTLRLYSSYPAPNPDWFISLKPAQDPSDPATARPGFGVADGGGNTRLFIDASGNIGVGTNTPTAKLTVNEGDVHIEGGRYRRLRIISDEYWAGIEIVAKQGIPDAHPHIDFTNGDPTGNDYDVRVYAPGPDELRILGGQLTVPGGLSIEGSTAHIEADGALYRSGGQVYLTVDDNFYIRDKGTVDGPHAARFVTNPGASLGLYLEGKVVAKLKSTLLGVAVNDGSQTGVDRGVWLWGANDTNHVIYSAAPGPTGKSPANADAAAGHFNANHRMRFRTSKTQGFLFESHEEAALVDIDANTGSLWTKGAIRVGGSDLYFTNPDHNHSAFGNTTGYAAIENAKNHDALMILGRSTGSGSTFQRRVKLWDYLQVNGPLDVTGGALLTNISIGRASHGDINYAYESVQLQSNHNLRVWFGETERYVFTNGGRLQIKGNAGVLDLVGTDHAYIQWYPQGGGSRKGWIGYPTPDTPNMGIRNEAGGGITLTSAAWIQLETSAVLATGAVNANIKNFRIDHPQDPERRHLVHSTVEGPEIAVFYRGEATLRAGAATVELPAYFESLTRKGSRTVQLTPIFAGDHETSALAAGEVVDGRFDVHAIDERNRAQRFYWEVKAVRADVDPLEIEPLKDQTP